MIAPSRSFCRTFYLLILFCLIVVPLNDTKAQNTPKFKVIAFYTAKEDKAHISFVHEANRWFPKMAAKYNFQYDSTNNWHNMNAEFLAQLPGSVIFRYPAR